MNKTTNQPHCSCGQIIVSNQMFNYHELSLGHVVEGD
jgi:hypothetical protein